MITKHIKTAFRPTQNMTLTLEESQLFGYVFDENRDFNECLLNIDEIRAWRQDFLSFAPGKKIDLKLMTLVALHYTLMQQFYSETRAWCWPPNFADDVVEEKSEEEISQTYADKWMKPSLALKFIYIPINEIDHWYMMVVSLVHQTVFQLDTYPAAANIPKRHATMRKVCDTLFHIMLT